MKELSVTVELTAYTLNCATARATVTWGEDSGTAEFTIDACEGSAYTAELRATKGPRAETLIQRIRSELIVRTQDKAIHRARDAIKAAHLSADEAKARRERGPLEPMAPELEAKWRDHHALDQAVEAWKREQK